MLTLLLLVIFTALVFEFINGFHDTANSIATVVATKVINGETFRVVWEVLSGKRNRSLQLASLVIKTAK